MKKVFLFIVVLITLVAIPITVFVAMQQQEIRKKAAPATTIAMSPRTVTTASGEEFTLDATLDTGSNLVDSVQLYITYDPTKLEALTIINGAEFPRILLPGTVDQANGITSITVGAPSSAQPVTGTGTVAKIKFKAIAATSVPISVKFANNTFVGAPNESNNILIGSTPATVTVTGGQGAQSAITPTPTAIPHLSPTPTIVVSPTPAATTGATLVITSPTEESTVTSQTPTIEGSAAPGTTVTLTIYSDPITVVVTADGNGNWVYTPETPLSPGPHTVVAAAQDAAGATYTTTSAFVVAGAEQTASQTGVLIAGSIDFTIIMVAVALMFLATGAISYRFVR